MLQWTFFQHQLVGGKAELQADMLVLQSIKLELFKRLDPPPFDGRPNLVWAKHWFGFLEEQKVTFASYVLEGKADSQ